MKAFRREGQVLIAQFDEAERRILAGVFSDTALLLGTNFALTGDDPDAAGPEAIVLDWDSGAVAQPRDPAVARLLPNASLDADDAAEFRRFTEADIRRSKTDRLRLWFDALGSSGTVEVPAADAGEWVAPLTDVRLVLASRLEIATDSDAEEVYGEHPPGPDATEADYSRFALGQIYGALTWLQESLLAAMLTEQ